MRPKDLQQSGKQGLGANKRTAEYTLGAAAVGAIIGAIAGGGKGAVIGAGAGAGGGALTPMAICNYLKSQPADESSGGKTLRMSNSATNKTTKRAA
jgi:outer membrane lipoprotein SlyB